jgi:hypothetical protein
MNLWVPRSMPLAQAITGVAFGQMRRQRGDGLAQILRGHRDQDDVGARAASAIRDRWSRSMRASSARPAAADFRVAAPAICARRAPALRAIQHDVAPGPRGDAGQRRAPRAGADHRD